MSSSSFCVDVDLLAFGLRLWSPSHCFGCAAHYCRGKSLMRLIVLIYLLKAVVVVRWSDLKFCREVDLSACLGSNKSYHGARLALRPIPMSISWVALSFCLIVIEHFLSWVSSIKAFSGLCRLIFHFNWLFSTQHVYQAESRSFIQFSSYWPWLSVLYECAFIVAFVQIRVPNRLHDALLHSITID